MDEKNASKTAFLAILLILIAAFIGVVRPFAIPALFAGLIVVICSPVNDFLLGVLKGRKYASALCSTIFVIACVIAPLAAAVGYIVSNAIVLVNYMAGQIEAGQLSIAVDSLSKWLTARASEYSAYFPSGIDLRAELIGFLQSIGKVAYQYSPKVVAATAGMLGKSLLLVVFVFMLFAEGKGVFYSVMSLIPLKNSHKEILARDVRGVITGTFLGLLATSISQGILIGIGFYIAGIDNALTWCVVAMGVTLVPVIGGPLMYLPASAALYLGGATGMAVFMLIWGILIVSTADNLIKPLVLRGKVRVNPILLALGIIGGGLWLGGAGVVLGPLIVVLMMAMLKIYQREFQ